MNTKILVICVNYHCEHETCNFVNELSQQEHDLSLHIIVVNNNEADKGDISLESSLRQYKNVSLYQTKRNLGYYGAASWAFKRYVQESTLPDWIIVCNTDISFENSRFFSDLVRYHRDFQGAVIAPSIISSRTGCDQNPFLLVRPSRLRMHLYRLIFKYNATSIFYEAIANIKTIFKSLFRRHSRKPEEPNRLSSIYAPHGAFVIFYRTYFETGGSLEHGGFLFGEEVFVAESARRSGMEIVYDKRLRVIHSENVSTRNSKDRLKYRYEAARYCAKEFF